MTYSAAKSGVTLHDIIEDDGNSLNAVRLMAAIAVVASHAAYLVAGDPRAQPLSWGPYDLGGVAVNVFFVLSGMLLTRSFDRDPDWKQFAAARLLRIFPGLLVAGIVVAWIIGPLTAPTLASYFSDPHAFTYPFSSLVSFEEAHVDGGFANTTQPGEVNAPLWTIKYELTAYVIFLVLSVCGFLRTRSSALAFLVALGMILFLSFFPTKGWSVHHLIRFGFCFVLGVTFYHLRHALRPNWWIAVIGLATALPLGATLLGPIAWVVAPAYAALVLGSLKVPLVTTLTNRWDVSFGVYIYAWPLQQLAMGSHTVHHSALMIFLLPVLAALVTGLGSFVLVERPAMALRRRLASAFSIKLRRADRSQK